MTNPEAVTELRREITRRGWDHKATERIMIELLLHTAIAIAGMGLFLSYRNPFLRALGIIAATFGFMGVGTNTHTSSHYATSKKRWFNEALTYWGYPAFSGLSATYWWHKHVVQHHPAPNVIGVDPDADILPWFALTADETQAYSGLRRFYYGRLQFWTFPLAVGFINLNMLAGGWVHLIRMLFRSKGRKLSHWIDLAAMLLHYVIWIAVPLLFWPWQDVVAFYVLRAILLGYAMFAILAPGHLPAEAQRTALESAQHVDFFSLQTESTVSFRTGVIGRFLCSGLEYQVEHHLFPNISHIYYPELSIIVQKFCAERGLSYRCYSWPVALWKSWVVLRCPPPVVRAVAPQTDDNLNVQTMSS